MKRKITGLAYGEADSSMPAECYVTREHRVPLSDAALEVLRQVGEVRGGDFVFTADGRGGILEREGSRRA